MNIAIITSPFGLLPPKGIGAVEKIWYYLAEYFGRKNICVDFYSKVERANYCNNVIIHSVKGYQRTGILIGDLIKDFYYSLVALIKLKSCDILVLNTFWSPILCVFLNGNIKNLSIMLQDFLKDNSNYIILLIDLHVSLWPYQKHWKKK